MNACLLDQVLGSLTDIVCGLFLLTDMYWTSTVEP